MQVQTQTIARKNTYLATRGPYWIARLRDEYGITVLPKPWHFEARSKVPAGGTYGVTFFQPPLIIINAHLWEVGLDCVDEMIVHELIHATGGREVMGHGPEFKRRYGKIYPWSRPGPVTEHDSGTPRRVLWGRITRELPHGQPRPRP